MRRVLVGITVAALLVCQPVVAAPVAAEPVRALAVQSPSNQAPYAAGLGTAAGIVGLNALALGVGALTGGWTYVAIGVVTVPAETSLATLGGHAAAAVAGGAGAVAGTAVYDWITGERHDYGYVMALTLGAFGGVAAGGLLRGPLGIPPHIIAAGPGAGTAAQVASHLYVIASGMLGATAASWLYGEPGPPMW
ncbi:MAG TPA: hypothetical protein VGE72_16755 [Azospirillum sp.]